MKNSREAVTRSKAKSRHTATNIHFLLLFTRSSLLLEFQRHFIHTLFPSSLNISSTFPTWGASVVKSCLYWEWTVSPSSLPAWVSGDFFKGVKLGHWTRITLHSELHKLAVMCKHPAQLNWDFKDSVFQIKHTFFCFKECMYVCMVQAA